MIESYSKALSLTVRLKELKESEAWSKLLPEVKELLEDQIDILQAVTNEVDELVDDVQDLQSRVNDLELGV